MKLNQELKSSLLKNFETYQTLWYNVPFIDMVHRLLEVLLTIVSLPTGRTLNWILSNTSFQSQVMKFMKEGALDMAVKQIIFV